MPSYDFDGDTAPAPTPNDSQMVQDNEMILIQDNIAPADPMDVQLEGHKKGDPILYNYELVQEK